MQSNINITCNKQVVLIKTFMNKKNKKRSDCPISCSLDIWGDKWSLLIIRNLMFHNINTYGEFLKAPEKIATNILADRLVSLEKSGLISKREHPESRAKIFYHLTPMGIDLLPVMMEISIWAEKYFEISAMSREMISQVKKNKKNLIKSLTMSGTEA
jgi:DNA-binding HxlR family transcriptional regulator